MQRGGNSNAHTQKERQMMDLGYTSTDGVSISLGIFGVGIHSLGIWPVCASFAWRFVRGENIVRIKARHDEKTLLLVIIDMIPSHFTF